MVIGFISGKVGRLWLVKGWCPEFRGTFQPSENGKGTLNCIICTNIPNRKVDSLLLQLSGLDMILLPEE